MLPSLASAGLLVARLGFVNRKSDVVWGERVGACVGADVCPRVPDLPGLMGEDAGLIATGRKSEVRNR